MLLNHLAAILVFGGPFFYLGLWMAIDPTGVAGLLGLLVRGFQRPVTPTRGFQSAVRCVGVLLALFAIAI